jgi:hypothetical protein
MKKLLILSVLVLTACATSFKTVMTDCDVAENQEFSKFKNCIQSSYIQKGGDANSYEYKGFAAKLDEINEDYTSKKITSTQAKSITYQEFENWKNRVNPPSSGASKDGSFKVIQPQKPINCRNYGAYTSCY